MIRSNEDEDRRLPFQVIRIVGQLACAAIPIFVAVTLAFGRYPSPVQYGTVLLFGLVAIFALKPIMRDGTGSRSVLDLALNVVLIAISVAVWAYFTNQYDEIASLREGLPNNWDMLCYAAGTLVVIAGAHRAEGWLLTSVVLAAIGYLAFGHLMPGILEHRAFSVTRILEASYSYRGIFGIALGSVVDIVLVFVVLGAALRLTGVGELFNDLALMLTRGRRSGPAQCAVVASALFGSINGSAPANVASTGVLTIPMMRRAGYSPRFAGGVEATASCVGQLMPPVMGVGAFIMSDITGIPYVEIMAAAILPALLYLASLSISVSLEAGRLDLKPMADADDLGWTPVRWLRLFLLVLSFGTLLTLLFSGYPPTYAGLVATGVLLAAASLSPLTRSGPRRLLAFLIESGRDGLSVLLSCAAIGIVLAAITSTGLGIRLNQEITALGSDSLFLALLLAALCSVVLGMGLPTAASYLMVIFVAGPAIMSLGVPELSAHMFVFYFAVLSAITPPVALAVFSAAAIARENPIKLAVQALRLALVGFVLPLTWVYHPELLIGIGGSGVLGALQYVPLLLLGIAAFSATHVGFFQRRLHLWERGVLLIAALATVGPERWINVFGAICILAMGLWIMKSARHD